jgi:predicted amidophosphoribosyltransferase
LFVWGNYGGLLKRAIASLKYDGHRELAEIMGQWLGRAWLASPRLGKTKRLTVVPIPLHGQKLKARGFNQAELIARSFSQMTGYPLQPQGLQRVRETQAMFGLNPTEREANIRGAFRLGTGLQQRRPPAPILLLDDIYTMGTTVTEAAKVLRQHKIPVFGVAAIAKPPFVPKIPK